MYRFASKISLGEISFDHRIYNDKYGEDRQNFDNFNLKT